MAPPTMTETATTTAQAEVGTLVLHPNLEVRDKYHNDLPGHNLRALWHNEMRAFDGRPNTSCIPHVWKYAHDRNVILEAQKVTSTTEAERRALLMVNPGIKRAPYTTDSVLAAWQLLLPKERALCHRHTVFAIRFLIEGSGAFTAVGGKKMQMEKGDLILTTQYNWHDHGNDGDDPVIWLDGLDQPMFEGSFPINFQIRLMEHPNYGGARYHEATPASGADAPSQYKWRDMRASLVALGTPHARLEYLNPLFADGHISRTLAAYAERLLPGTKSPRRQETCNNIYHCVEGRGRTIVEARDPKEPPTVLEWTVGDTFALPSWYAFAHEAETEAFLFNYNDFSALEKLGFYNDASTYLRP